MSLNWTNRQWYEIIFGTGYAKRNEHWSTLSNCHTGVHKIYSSGHNITDGFNPKFIIEYHFSLYVIFIDIIDYKMN